MSSIETQQYIQKLKRMTLHELWDEYEVAFGVLPPRTKSLRWLYYNVGYMFQETHTDGALCLDHTRRFTEWKNKLTPEQEMIKKFAKLKAPVLKELCEQYQVKYQAKGKAKQEMLASLAWNMAELEPITEGETTNVQVEVKGQVVKVTKPTTTGKKARRKGSATDGLPKTVKELLALKADTTDKVQQRNIRRALRAIDPNWNKKK